MKSRGINIPRRNGVKGLPAAEITLVVFAVIGISMSAPLASRAAAPALAIAFWRNAMGTGVMTIQTAARGKGIPRLGKSAGRCVLAGIFLAFHFALWTPSLKMTSVAASTALVSTAPLWAGLFAALRGHWPSPAAWTGLAVVVAGAVTVSGIALDSSARALTGDFLALGGGACFAAYLTVGGVVRKSLGTTEYALACYGIATIVLFIICLATGRSLSGYSLGTWLALAALTACGQLLGHSLLNRSLKLLSASTVAVISLLEVPGAALIAALWLRQLPTTMTWLGAALILAGLWVTVRAQTRVPATAGSHQPESGAKTEIT